MPIEPVSLSNPVLVYSALAINGILMLVVLWHVHARLRRAHVVLARLQSDFTSAETRFSGLLDQTQHRLQTLPVGPNAPVRRGGAVNADLRNQVLALRKKGLVTTDIARSCGLSDAEVEVLLGVARMTGK